MTLEIGVPFVRDGELAFIKSPRSSKRVTILPHPSPSSGGKNVFRYSQQILSSRGSFEETGEDTRQDQPWTSPDPSLSSLDPLTSSDEESGVDEDDVEVAARNDMPYSWPRWSKTYGKDRCRWYLQTGRTIIEAPPKVPSKLKLDKYTIFVHESGFRRQMWVNEGSQEVRWVAADEGYERTMGNERYQLKYGGKQIRWVLKDTYARRRSIDPVFDSRGSVDPVCDSRGYHMKLRHKGTDTFLQSSLYSSSTRTTMSEEVSYDCDMLSEEEPSDQTHLNKSESWKESLPDIDNHKFGAQLTSSADICQVVDEALCPLRKRIEMLESAYSRPGFGNLEPVLAREITELRRVLEPRAGFQDVGRENMERDISVIFSRLDNLERQQKQDVKSLSRDLNQVETELEKLKDNTFFEQKCMQAALRHRKQDLDKQALEMHGLQCLVSQHVQRFEDWTNKCGEVTNALEKHSTLLFNKARGAESGLDQLNIDVLSMKSEISKTEMSIQGLGELINSSNHRFQSLYESLCDSFNQADGTSTWTSMRIQDECITKHWEFEKELKGLQSEISTLVRNSILQRSQRTLEEELTEAAFAAEGGSDGETLLFHEWACRSLDPPHDPREVVRAERGILDFMVGIFRYWRIFTLVAIPLLLSLLWLEITDLDHE
ncbi:hypothetical protein AGABI1DRAFT_133474 [Agaricus bisporus var. burnettii JB137-S8]|uniref:Uncharacterized protein n=1 Tax=Agaricus bisporus var. burnettii (strain JB137-S8 / ATCC MYA-4627 / FGSC 10392) TaxID=597362 RepID=K5WG49_AGABU|nr:uncharacterized protein AGABI1DRAFT_133474 [Agaricus bisporus var. burnettii JB137-S8]EKM74236.1 hypothetical protein AGABI1DRAFT_133474 [Agaricus bisporus var. burnettii JB137-S8]